VRDALGKDIDFSQLPRDRNGNIVSIERARAMVKTERNIAVRELMNTHFPPSKRNDDTLFRDARAADGKVYRVPREDHPNYAQFITECDIAHEAIDQRYQQKYGDAYQKFSESVFGGADKDKVTLVGRTQDRLFSDIDATFRDPAQAAALKEVMRKNGLTVETDPGGHSLYVKVKELDWLAWGKETVGDLQQRFEAETDPARKQQLGAQLSAAMKDVEVCASTVGARHAIFGEGAADPAGAKLDHIKKYAQSSDLYTKDKVTGKLLKMDIGEAAYKDALKHDPAKAASQVLSQHGGENRALRMEHLPEALRKDVREQYLAATREQIVDSYKKSVIESRVMDEQRARASRGLYEMAELSAQAGNAEQAMRLRAEADAVEADRKRIRESNTRTLIEIARKDPDLAKRLVGAEKEVLANLKREPDDSRAARETGARRTQVRSGVEALAAPKPWLPVAKEAATQLADQTGAVFDTVGKLGGYAAMADAAMMLEAEGKGSANAHFIKAVATDYATDKVVGKLTEKFPKLGGMLEIIDVPTMVVAEMEQEMDEAAARGGSMWGAKARGIVNTIKAKTFIGTLEKTLNEEGMAEVENEMRTGNYSFAAVAYRTAVVTVGEVTQMNAIMRYGTNTYFGVYDAEKAARKEFQNMEHKLRAKTLASDASLTALRAEIIRLQVDADADDPVVQAEIARLQSQFEGGVKQMRTLAGNMRKHYKADDPQLEDLYKRSQIAIEAQKRELLEAKLVRIAAAHDTMDVQAFLDLRKLRDEYRVEVENYKKSVQRLHKLRGGEDPLVREMMADLRTMKNTAERMEAVKFDINDQRHRENEAARVEREKQLAGYAEQLRANADRLPPGLSAEDGALVVEMDDLRMRQEKGEIPANADLVALAGANVDRDVRYQQLLRKQRDGEIPEDADLLALLDGETAAADAAPLAPDADMNAFAGLAPVPDPGDAAADVPELEDPEAGEEIDEIAFELAEPVTEPVPYVEPPETRDIGNGVVVQSGQLNGKSHGARIEWKNGQIVSYQSCRSGTWHGPQRRYENGVIASESFMLDGKHHGPMRSFKNGVLVSEGWFKHDTPHGWQRSFTPDGAVTHASLHVDGIKRAEIQWDKAGKTKVSEYVWEADETLRVRRNWNAADGILQNEAIHEYPVPARGVAVLLRTRLPESDDTYSEVRRNKDGKRVGMQRDYRGNPDVAGAVVLTESLYSEDGELRWVKRSVVGCGMLEETHYRMVGGEPVRHGTCREWFPQHDRQNAFGLRTVTEFRDGLAHGRYVRYRSKDPKDIEVEADFQEGLAHGVVKLYHQNGYSSGDLSRGRPTGAQRDYRDGKLVLELLFGSDGSIVRYREWNQDGLPLKDFEGRMDTAIPPPRIPERDQLLRSVFVPSPFVISVSRVLTGSAKVWEVDRATGKHYLKWESGLREGKMHGLHKWYYPNGKLREEIHWADGEFDGSVRTWFEDGRLEAEVTYVKGVREGKGRWFDSSSGHYFECELKDHVGVGWMARRHPNGALKILRYCMPLSPEEAADPKRRRTTNHRSAPAYDWDYGHTVGPLGSYDETGKLTSVYYYIYEDGKSKGVDKAVFDEWCTRNGALNVPRDLPANFQ